MLLSANMIRIYDTFGIKETFDVLKSGEYSLITGNNSM